MQFFLYRADISNGEWREQYETPVGGPAPRRFTNLVRSKMLDFNSSHREERFLFPAVLEENEASVCLMLLKPENGNAAQLAEAFLSELGIRPELAKCTEITRLDYVKHAEQSPFPTREDDIYCGISLYDIDSERRAPGFDEYLIAEQSEEEIRCRAGELLADDTFGPELDRIYAPSNAPAGIGHPVHYLLQAGDKEEEKELCGLLLSALHANGRLRNRRFACVSPDPDLETPPGWYELLYRSCAGGAVVIRLGRSNTEEGETADSLRDVAESIADAAKRCRNEVLTVFCLPQDGDGLWDTLRGYLDTMAFVTVRENLSDAADSVKYLRSLAAEKQLTADEALEKRIDPERTYFPQELNRIFSEWQDLKLRKELYPQYADIQSITAAERKAAAKGNAYRELEEMVGLTEAKKVLNEALCYFKARKLFASHGIADCRPAMHMVFTGNPGTAKTTVARLFARILKDNGVLTSGKLVECGRGDLVGRFVGWTAPNIQKKFREAKDGVLFIDEAYSLVDDRSGSFGDEAINTIVQEMENHRTDVLVIFAGYPDKMEAFLGKNPGLRSRIAFHVPFADYTAEELVAITELHAERQGMRFAENAVPVLRTLYSGACRDSDFGNGRYARNVLEQARLAQAERICALDEAELTDSVLRTILAEDLPQPHARGAETVRRIGF